MTEPPDDTRRMLRVEMGRVLRQPARGRVDSATMPKQRRPSMPKLPWDDQADDEQEVT